jgi:cytochrome b561
MSIAVEQGGRPRTTVREYRMPAKVLHWLTVGFVAFMVASGVIATQLGDGWMADILLRLHRLTGAATLVMVFARLIYRLTRSMPRPLNQSWSRPILHWTLYGIVILVPLLGWTGASDFGHTELPFGYSLPPIFPQNTGFGEMLLRLHAYMAFTLLALVAIHIGAAMHDYMTSDGSAAPRE